MSAGASSSPAIANVNPHEVAAGVDAAVKDAIGRLSGMVGKNGHPSGTSAAAIGAEEADSADINNNTANANGNPAQNTLPHSLARSCRRHAQSVGGDQEPLAVALKQLAAAEEGLGDARVVMVSIFKTFYFVYCIYIVLFQDATVQSEFCHPWAATLNTNIQFAQVRACSLISHLLIYFNKWRVAHGFRKRASRWTPPGWR